MRISDELYELLKRVEKQDPTLVELKLSNQNLTDEHIAHIAPILARSRVITSIDLSHNRIGNQGAQVLAELLRQNIPLEYLNLNNNQIGAEGLNLLMYAGRISKMLLGLNHDNNPIDFKFVTENRHYFKVRQEINTARKFMISVLLEFPDSYPNAPAIHRIVAPTVEKLFTGSDRRELQSSSDAQCAFKWLAKKSDQYQYKFWVNVISENSSPAKSSELFEMEVDLPENFKKFIAENPDTFIGYVLQEERLSLPEKMYFSHYVYTHHKEKLSLLNMYLVCLRLEKVTEFLQGLRNEGNSFFSLLKTDIFKLALEKLRQASTVTQDNNAEDEDCVSRPSRYKHFIG